MPIDRRNAYHADVRRRRNESCNSKFGVKQDRVGLVTRSAAADDVKRPPILHKFLLCRNCKTPYIMAHLVKYLNTLYEKNVASILSLVSYRVVRQKLSASLRVPNENRRSKNRPQEIRSDVISDQNAICVKTDSYKLVKV